MRPFSARWLLLICISGLAGALAFPLALPLGSRRELFASGVLEPLAFVCLIPALVAMRKLRPGGAFLTGFSAGMVFFTGAFWWVTVAMTTFAFIPLLLAVPILLLLVAWCALHWGLAFAVTRFLADRTGWPVGLAFAPVWMATELMRNYFCSGFPWANLGYSQARNLWLSQIASVLGVYGIAFLVAWVNGTLYEVLRAIVWKERRFPKGLVASSAAVLVLCHIYGAVRVNQWDKKLASADRARVAVIQGNIDQRIKSEQGAHAEWVLRAYNPATVAADAAGADLIIWPEAAFPQPLITGTASVAKRGLAKSEYRAHLLVGVDIFNPANLRSGSENAAFVVKPDLKVAYKYVKYHLVPFGEYVLFDLDKYLPISNVVPGTFTRGTELRPIEIPLAGDGRSGRSMKIGIEICFDAIFPEISRTYANRGANLLVNITNDAWYGYSSAPFQFLRMVAMRGIETGRPVARAANTGISAFIDPLGRIRQATALGLVDDLREVERGQLVAPQWRMEEVPVVSERTPYDVIGDLPAYLASLCSVFGLTLGLIKGRRAVTVPEASAAD
jgi:apolipoprotein N-acyltransferase